jgi:cytochrome P450
VFRALALLAGRAKYSSGSSEYLRAVFLDTQRLSPTTPVILRETTEETRWGDKTLTKGTGIVIFTPFL